MKCKSEPPAANWPVSAWFAPIGTFQGMVGGLLPQLRTPNGANGLLADRPGRLPLGPAGEIKALMHTSAGWPARLFLDHGVVRPVYRCEQAVGGDFEHTCEGQKLVVGDTAYLCFNL